MVELVGIIYGIREKLGMELGVGYKWWLELIDLGMELGIWYGIRDELGMELGCGFDRSWVWMLICTDFLNLYEYYTHMEY